MTDLSTSTAVPLQPSAGEQQIAAEWPARHTRSGLAQRVGALPYLLGCAAAAVSLFLAWAELAEPKGQRGLRVVYFSNVIHSKGSRAALLLYRQRLDRLPFVGSQHVLAPTPYVRSLRAGLMLLFLLQAAALWVALRETRPSLRRWVVGASAAAICLLLYPPISTDVFYYASVGEEANRGGNPYLRSPKVFGQLVFDPFSDWQRITVPYGPVWTWVSRLVDAATGTSPFATSIGFKILIGASALGLGLVTAALAKQLTGEERAGILGFILVAWSPIALYESAGTAHFDPFMMLLALGGLLLMSTAGRGRTRAGLLLIAASALCKPVTLPLLASAALVRLAKRDDPLWLVAARWAGDALAALALAAVAYGVYWGNGGLPRAVLASSRRYVDRPNRANTFWYWVLPEFGFGVKWLKGDGPQIIQAVATLIVVIAIAWRAWQTLRVRLTPGPSPSATALLRWQVSTWAIAMIAEGSLPSNAHAWYTVWSLPLMALIAIDRGVVARFLDRTTARGTPPATTESRASWLTWAVVIYFAWISLNFVVYHTLTRG